MNFNQRKTLNTKIKNGDTMSFRDALNMFFLPEDQDAFARSHGYADAEQMDYYQKMDQLPPPPDSIQVDGLIAELSKIDSREVYGDFESCPLADWYDTNKELEGYPETSIPSQNRMIRMNDV